MRLVKPTRPSRPAPDPARAARAERNRLQSVESEARNRCGDRHEWARGLTSARWIPSLTALRTFDAVGRLGVAEAAAALNVTPAAISHQIRTLEAEVGVTLFERSPRGLVLNKAGRAFLSDVAGAFDAIHSGTRRLKDPRRGQRLVVDVLSSFANDFIIPRLPRFYEANPGFELELQTIGRRFGPIDFSRSGAHVAIRGGGVAGEWPEQVAEKLAHEVFHPVCAPALMRGANALRSPADLAKHPLLVVTTAPEGWAEWLAAAESQGHDVSGIDFEHALRSDTFHSDMLAAIEGLGVALGRGPLVDLAVASGRLVSPFGIRVASTHAYWLIYPESAREHPAFRGFREWLFKELRLAGAAV
jgi:LysR family glycine cleavage system transcriptional activator